MNKTYFKSSWNVSVKTLGTILLVTLLGCGGEGGSGSVTTAPSAYTVGATVAGLNGSQLSNSVVLQDNGGNTTTLTANGSFTFSGTISNGATYAVIVASQPSGQNCTVTNGSGTIVGSNITNVAVNCQDNNYNVGATVIGLDPSTSVVLQINGGGNLTFTANGTANFNATLSSGSTYAVTVLTQPTNEVCTVPNGSGTISNANVTVSVACASNTASNPAGTGRGTLTAVPTATGNVIPLVVDAGPITGSPSINVGYVSVTVCTPGTSGSTAACQTIDHVQLDTGSYGLRLLNSQLSSNLNLPAATNISDHAVGECLTFVIGVTWGSVRLADVYVGGEVARSIPIQDIGDFPAGYSSVPTDCTSTGSVQDTQATLGANGILGVGNFVNDCDACLTTIIPATYYDCTSSGCTKSTITVPQMVKNPVAEFQNPTTGVVQDNNGEMMTLPAVGSGGSTGITGSVTFGIGTQTNNALSGTVYPTDVYGNFITNYKGTTMYSSYLDSGSNGFFFNDNTLLTCSDGWYCPTSPLALTATNSGASGSPSGSVNFSLVNADNLFSNSSIVAGNIGAPGSRGSFAWGLPFFYGRTVFTAISGASTPSGVGPYWAY